MECLVFIRLSTFLMLKNEIFYLRISKVTNGARSSFLLSPNSWWRGQIASLQHRVLMIHLTAVERSMSSSARACPSELSHLLPNSAIRRATCSFPPICCHLSSSPPITGLLSHLKLASILHVIGWWDFLSGSWIQPSRSSSLLIFSSQCRKKK